MNENQSRRYTTELSKGQGAVSETLTLLRIWQPGMPAKTFAQGIVEAGVLGRSTAVRTRDLVQRVFARRYLVDDGAPAEYLKYLNDKQADAAVIKQIMLVYTTRLHAILRDFISEVFWLRYAAGAEKISRSDAEEFIERPIVSKVLRTSRSRVPWRMSCRDSLMFSC